MNRGKTLMAEALFGAFTGLVAAMILSRRAEKNEKETALTAGEGLKLGMLLFGLLRAVSSLGDEK